MEKKKFCSETFNAGKALHSDETFNTNVRLGHAYQANVLPTEEEEHPYMAVLDTGERCKIVSDRVGISAFDKVTVRVSFIKREKSLIEVKVI